MRVWNFEEQRKKWKDAEESGKVRYISKNEWYYEY